MTQAVKNKPNLMPWLAIVGAVAVGAGMALAGSDGTIRVAGLPVFALGVAIAFLIQWIAFAPAYAWQTERFFDLTGSITFLVLVCLALVAAEQANARAWCIALFVAIWAVRLGWFLAARVHRDGFDRRFRTIKPDFATFLMTWTLQGIWVTLALGPGLAAISAETPAPADAFLLVGGLLWALGFGLEVIADEQKRRFRANPENAGRFIRHGLWAWSRHPNYFGEILLWIGITIVALPTLTGWAYLTLISPIWIWLLLTRISGVRMLEVSGRRRWGDDPEYQAYRARTPMLVPLPRRK